MIRIVTGPFHPDLEDALVEAVRDARRADRFTPLAVIVPSRLLLDHLSVRLVVGCRQPLLNVHFLTFHQLALRLAAERSLTGTTDDCALPTVVSDFFFHYLIGWMTRQDTPAATALGASRLPLGGAAAVWATMRDLKDAAVEPESALRAVREGHFDQEDAPALAALFAFYDAVLTAARAAGVGAVDDLTASVTEWVPQSRLVGEFARIFYYGFYDITQVQLSLLEAVSKRTQVTVFFPREDRPAYRFADEFLTRHLVPLSGAPPMPAPISSAGMEPAIIQRITTVGPEDELTVVCKEILVLVESHGYAFDEIGVVGRTLEPYRAYLRFAFTRHRIPFVSNAGTAITAEPAVKILLHLARLPFSGFARAPMLDVLCASCARAAESPPARPDLWRVAVAALGIRRGEADWRRLAAVAESEGARRPELRALGDRVNLLLEDCRAMPARGTPDALTDAFLSLARRHLTLAGVTDDQEASPVAAAMQQVFAQLRQLGRLDVMLSWPDWVELFERLLEQTRLPITPEQHPGVKVLDAMAARGLPFRALFLLGLNEKIFPRFIREDAFLRDRHRRVLDGTLGNKIDQKLAGYDEEYLLFTLLTRAARSRLYLMWHRADLDVRALAPSSYLADAALAGGEGPVVAVSRRASARATLPQFALPLLTPDELGIRLLAAGRDPAGWLDRRGQGGLFRQGRAALAMLEAGRGPIGAYDGNVGTLEAHWTRLATRGISPTALETYARCPFQFFARHVLGLTVLRDADLEDIAPHVIGHLMHETLRLAMERLTATGWPVPPLDRVALRERAAAAAEQSFARHAADCGTGYALIWDMVRDTVVALVAASLELDQAGAADSGYRPAAFELDAEGSLEGLPGGPIKIRGRLDRVDRREAPAGLRIVDYKFKQSGELGPHDRDLVLGAVRGARLQPPLYALMQVAGLRADRVEFRFLTMGQQPMVVAQEFEAAAWTGPAAAQLRETLQRLLDGVRQGRYFMLPDGYCDHCEFTASCRRFHQPSWWRGYAEEAAKQLRKLRKAKVARA